MLNTFSSFQIEEPIEKIVDDLYQKVIHDQSIQQYTKQIIERQIIPITSTTFQFKPDQLSFALSKENKQLIILINKMYEKILFSMRPQLKKIYIRRSKQYNDFWQHFACSYYSYIQSQQYISEFQIKDNNLKQLAKQIKFNFSPLQADLNNTFVIENMWEDWVKTRNICQEQYSTKYITDFYNNVYIKKSANQIVQKLDEIQDEDNNIDDIDDMDDIEDIENDNQQTQQVEKQNNDYLLTNKIVDDTVYNWFDISNITNTADTLAFSPGINPEEITDCRGLGPSEVDMYLSDDSLIYMKQLNQFAHLAINYKELTNIQDEQITHKEKYYIKLNQIIYDQSQQMEPVDLKHNYLVDDIINIKRETQQQVDDYIKEQIDQLNHTGGKQQYTELFDYIRTDDVINKYEDIDFVLQLADKIYQILKTLVEENELCDKETQQLSSKSSNTTSFKLLGMSRRASIKKPDDQIIQNDQSQKQCVTIETYNYLKQLVYCCKYFIGQLQLDKQYAAKKFKNLYEIIKKMKDIDLDSYVDIQ